MKNHNAEDFWWYRLVKTLYILAVGAFIVVSGIFVFSDRYGLPPKTDFYSSTYGYKCLHNNISGGKFEGKDINYDSKLGTDQKFGVNPFGSLPQMNQILSKICLNAKIPESDEDFEQLFNQKDVDLTEMNHEIVITNEVKDKTNKEFIQEMIYVLAGFALLVLIAVFLIPKVFNYILFGKRKSPEVAP